MVIQFTLQDLMLFLVYALGFAAGILLLAILWNVKKAVGNLWSLVETNQEFIKKTIRTMPGIFENVEQISSNVRETTDKLKVSVPLILQEVEGVTNAAKETVATYKKDTTGFMAYFHIIEEVVQIIDRTFFSRK